MKTIVSLLFALFTWTTWAQDTTLTLLITSADLSEDVSTFSTKDDELLLLLFLPNSPWGEPILQEYIRLSKQQMQAKRQVSEFPLPDSVFYFLLEIDSEKKVDAIVPLIKKHADTLIPAFQKKDYTLIRKLLGDEDILGLGRWSTQHPLDIQGRHKIDRYAYRIELLH